MNSTEGPSAAVLLRARREQLPTSHRARAEIRRSSRAWPRLRWWRHPGYIGVRRRDFYAWKRRA